MLDKIDELFESVHTERSQTLKVDKILSELAKGDEIEKDASDKLAVHLKNPIYTDQTIVTVFKNLDYIVSLSAVRTWRIRNGVERR